MNEIIFEDIDSPQQTAIKTVQLWCGTSELKPQLKKLGIDYVKCNKGVHVVYILRGKEIGRIEVKL